MTSLTHDEAGEKYDMSMKVGEQGLLPRVRAASPETLIVADGFSCRTQIEQGTNRRPLHLAELIRMAMNERSAGPTNGEG